MKKYFAMTFWLLASVVLSACSITPNPLAAELRKSMFISSYDVQYTQYYERKNDAAENLPPEIEFVLRLDTPESEGTVLSISEEKRIQILEFLGKLETALSSEFEQSPLGATPVILKVNVTRYDRYDKKDKLLWGKSDGAVGENTFVNAETKEVVGIYPGYAHWQSFGLAGAWAESITKPDINLELARDFARNLRRIAEIP